MRRKNKNVTDDHDSDEDDDQNNDNDNNNDDELTAALNVHNELISKLHLYSPLYSLSFVFGGRTKIPSCTSSSYNDSMLLRE